MLSHSSQNFQVRKDDLRNVQIVTPKQTPLRASEVRFKIDRFALTSNNITYAAFGDRMKYWDFYPAADGWGVIPVWGFADVVGSMADGVNVGERFYGYFPMSSHVTLKVAKSNADGFTEGTELRQALAVVYNQYTRTAADPLYDKTRESEQALLKPLFMTSWLVADMLADNQFFGAQTVILSSASSKTAYGTAHAIKQLPASRPQVIGLTSQRNKAFTQSLGCYDEVRTYEEIGVLPTTTKAVYVDMSGDAPVRAALHTHFSDQLAYSCSVGGTHWENLAGGGALAGPRPQLCFAPAQIKKRAAEWGQSELQIRMRKAWTGFLPQVSEWMQVIESRGPDAIKQTYLTVLDGKAVPNEGHMLGF
jgi:hypothetical protein